MFERDNEHSAKNIFREFKEKMSFEMSRFVSQVPFSVSCFNEGVQIRFNEYSVKCGM